AYAGGDRWTRVQEVSAGSSNAWGGGGREAGRRQWTGCGDSCHVRWSARCICEAGGYCPADGEKVIVGSERERRCINQLVGTSAVHREQGGRARSGSPGRNLKDRRVSPGGFR